LPSVRRILYGHPMKLKSLPNFPKMKIINGYNLSPNPDLPNNAEVRRQGFNQCLTEVGELEVPIPSVDEMSVVTSEFLDEGFPKGKCKERGQALVLHAQMLIAIHNLIIQTRRI